MAGSQNTLRFSPSNAHFKSFGEVPKTVQISPSKTKKVQPVSQMDTHALPQIKETILPRSNSNYNNLINFGTATQQTPVRGAFKAKRFTEVNPRFGSISSMQHRHESPHKDSVGELIKLNDWSQNEFMPVSLESKLPALTETMSPMSFAKLSTLPRVKSKLGPNNHLWAKIENTAREKQKSEYLKEQMHKNDNKNEMLRQLEK